MNKPLIKYSILILVILGGCLADLGSKSWARANYKGKAPAVLVTNLLDVGFSENRGMVFGILNDGKPHKVTTYLTIMRFAILLGVMVFIGVLRTRPLSYLLPFAIVAAGAWGNCIDGAMNGHVTDFIHLHLGSWLDWPFYFNLADAYLCVGVGLLLIKSFLPTAGTNAAIKS
jgi:signal peptidase II